jgi:hypothetical protein
MEKCFGGKSFWSVGFIGKIIYLLTAQSEISPAPQKGEKQDHLET